MEKELNAFPTQSWEYDGQDNVLQYQEPGMSLLDYFAAKAMASVPLSLDINEQQLIANAAYRQARAMLKAREGE